MKDRLERQADAWMQDNEKTMDLFVTFAEEMLLQGKKFGVGLLTERVRWESTMKGESFRIPNSHRAYIARRLIEILPGLEKLIRTRTTKGELTGKLVLS